MSKKPEMVNPISEEKPKYKVCAFFNHIITHKEHPVSMGWIMDLRRDLIEWSKSCDTAMNPYQFIQDRGISRRTCQDWCARIPEFAEGFQIARDFIALRRENKYIEANPSGALGRMMSFYDDDYRIQEERMAKLKASETTDDKRPITVVIPERRKKDE